MGTRHLQTVIDKNGVKKISQYGQWDGYPSGQGKDILNFLRTADLEQYQIELDKIHQITEQEIKEVNECKNWTKEYPHMSRDCGSNIHQMILDGQVKFVAMCSEEEANHWCEGFYTIDFQKNEFTTVYDNERTYKLNELPTEEQYLKDTEPSEEE